MLAGKIFECKYSCCTLLNLLLSPVFYHFLFSDIEMKFYIKIAWNNEMFQWRMLYVAKNTYTIPHDWKRKIVLLVSYGSSYTMPEDFVTSSLGRFFLLWAIWAIFNYGWFPIYMMQSRIQEDNVSSVMYLLIPASGSGFELKILLSSRASSVIKNFSKQYVIHIWGSPARTQEWHMPWFWKNPGRSYFCPRSDISPA